MKPKFKTALAWQQAELLMQPCLIRLLDNIRKYLELSEWEGSYENVQTPVPGYHLFLKREDNTVKFDVWELCYQICFINYQQSHTEAESKEVDIDTSLIDEDNENEVDWTKLDMKAKQLVQDMFSSLPNHG